MRFTLLSALALAGSVLALSPANAVAAGAAGYSARLTAPLSAPRTEIVGDVLWKCAGDRCLAADAGSRPVVMCQRIARKFGEVAEFHSAMGDLKTEELAKCNAH